MSASLPNDLSSTFSWSGLHFQAPKSFRDRLSWRPRSKPKTLLDNIHGSIICGQMLAIMGPSGAGKSTLLDALAGRVTLSEGKVGWSQPTPSSTKQEAPPLLDIGILSSYVEQHDTLLGVLTVRETLYYSAKLSMDMDTSESEVDRRVETVLSGLGLASVADNQIGTPIKRGISGGQKRRVTIGCSLVAMPRILFLDEPTSGLDIQSAHQVMTSIAGFARRYNIAVCATIHSPNRDIFRLFGSVMLLARGRTMYYGPTKHVESYFAEIGEACPTQTNPADHMLRIVSDESYAVTTSADDLEKQLRRSGARGDVAQLSALWQARVQKQDGQTFVEHVNAARASPSPAERTDDILLSPTRPDHSLLHLARLLAFATWILTKRNLLNYRRNLLAYGVRFAMYLGMGVLLATVWVDLAKTDTRINDRLSVHFFSVAFLGFMSVAGIPSFLEERGVMCRERANGLYGPAPFTLANTLVTMPFLFACALVFAVIMYWSIGLHDGAVPFLRWLSFLYLGVLAAEMQSLLVAALLPIFVAALAIAAFLNGFWMTTQGYFIRTDNLPRFWYYWAHFINYETYALALLARTDLAGLTFTCATPGQCLFPSSSQHPDAVAGETVVSVLQFNTLSIGEQAAILLCIIVVYRILFYIALRFTRA
ncbi:P-loop containing nucleoside triphosphate hydrolase protein [Ceraceosorus guamensis]|uniref:P-loop containing nucleoside triphosphate hydrolase protein n=1 Tax=Ceraceosorus guamensis TaxID=1522189 RepID=A0A316VQP6_9BASI|nr:P-loop containing nucleoside triphosphate hydrolase protein [Ceraceosorus guamensis]PWN39927.1 P-loop containing nucleoside triphosphate hydrolase protein [Ceraceosorus guamensis]